MHVKTTRRLLAYAACAPAPTVQHACMRSCVLAYAGRYDSATVKTQPSQIMSAAFAHIFCHRSRCACYLEVPNIGLKSCVCSYLPYSPCQRLQRATGAALAGLHSVALPQAVELLMHESCLACYDRAGFCAALAVLRATISAAQARPVSVLNLPAVESKNSCRSKPCAVSYSKACKIISSCKGTSMLTLDACL